MEKRITNNMTDRYEYQIFDGFYDNKNETYLDIEKVLNIMNNSQFNNSQLKNHNNKTPEYYIKNGFSPLQAFQKGLLSKEEAIGFIKGNIIKYTVRCGSKESAIDDINKAINYLKELKKYYDK